MKSKCIHTWTQYEWGAECVLLVTGIVCTVLAKLKVRRSRVVLSLPHLTLHSHISIVANFGASTPACLFALYFDIPTQCKE